MLNVHQRRIHKVYTGQEPENNGCSHKPSYQAVANSNIIPQPITFHNLSGTGVANNNQMNQISVNAGSVLTDKLKCRICGQIIHAEDATPH